MHQILSMKDGASRPAGPAGAAARKIKIMVLSGEASGDQHAAPVVGALKEADPSVEVFGMGGSALRRAGMETIVDSEESASVMGLTEVFSSLRQLIGAFRTLKRAAIERRPDVIVAVDFPDFNMLFARSVSAYCSNIVYYITPQIWAWRKGRVRTIAKFFKKVLPIFPFEESFYHAHGVDAEYIGHPFLDRPDLQIDRRRFLQSCGLDPSRPVLALLPGSRNAEIERLVEPMCDALHRLQLGRPGLQAIVPVAPTLRIEAMQKAFGASGVVCVQGSAREILHCADAAVVASGTATLEAALASVPFVTVYKLSGLTYAVGRRMVRGVSHIAMVNLVLGRGAIPELIQDQATGARIAEEIERYLGDPAHRESVRRSLSEVRIRLALDDGGDMRSCDRVARVLFDLAKGA